MLPLRIKVLLQAAAAAVVAVRGPPLFFIRCNGSSFEDFNEVLGSTIGMTCYTTLYVLYLWLTPLVYLVCAKFK
jgi:hypothetical protein